MHAFSAAWYLHKSHCSLEPHLYHVALEQVPPHSGPLSVPERPHGRVRSLAAPLWPASSIRCLPQLPLGPTRFFADSKGSSVARPGALQIRYLSDDRPCLRLSVLGGLDWSRRKWGVLFLSHVAPSSLFCWSLPPIFRASPQHLVQQIAIRMELFAVLVVSNFSKLQGKLFWCAIW